MLNLRSFIICMLMTLLLSSAVNAKPALTNSNIEKWMASQQALQSWGEQHEEEIRRYEREIEQSQIDPLNLSAESMLKPLAASGLYGEAERIVKQHGFDTMEAWAEFTIHISKVAASIEMANMPADAFDTSEMEAIMNSGQMNAEQKAMMQQAIAQANRFKTELTQSVSAADRDAVRPYLERITRLMDEQ